MLRPELLEILCCPKCKSGLDYKQDQQILVCRQCQSIYQVKNDIPIMLVDEHEPVSRQQDQPSR